VVRSQWDSGRAECSSAEIRPSSQNNPSNLIQIMLAQEWVPQAPSHIVPLQPRVEVKQLTWPPQGKGLAVNESPHETSGRPIEEWSDEELLAQYRYLLSEMADIPDEDSDDQSPAELARNEIIRR
jgi:hypothetical protein